MSPEACLRNLPFVNCIPVIWAFLQFLEHTVKFLHSTENSTQLSMETKMGRESLKREDTCIHTADSLCHIAEANTTL